MKEPESQAQEKRRRKIEKEAREIMAGAPSAPRSSDTPQRGRQIMRRFERWTQDIAPRLRKDRALAQRVNELLEGHLGVSSEEAETETAKPEADALHDSIMGPPTIKASEYARRLMSAAGWTEVGLAERYTQVCRQHDQRMAVGWRAGDEIVVAMRWPVSNEIVVWVRGERGKNEPQHFIGPGDFN